MNTAKVVAAPGVLGNDSDPELNPLTAILVTDVAHGTLSLAANGGFTYTPTTDYSGPDSFTYKANDGALDSNIVTVSLTVEANPAPDAPTLNAPADGSSGVSTSPTLDVGVSDPQADPLTVTYYGRPLASGPFAQIAQHSGVASGGNDTFVWSGLGAGQVYEWYVTVGDGTYTTNGPTWTLHTAPGADPVFVGTGDIATCSSTGDTDTGNVIMGIDGTIFTTGDNVYPNGTAAEFTNCYAPTPWGDPSVKSRTRPVPGNHDWGTGATENLNGYNGYFGANATDANGKSYYSYDIDANWHVVNLDSECQLVPGGCGAGSLQEIWLRADLAAHASQNVIAVWHKPRYSSGATDYQAVQPLWDALYDAGVDILLVGHDHIYERTAPMKSGATLADQPVADPLFGIRQFTVGTGGESHHGLSTPLPTSEVSTDAHYGILKLTLHPTGYDWNFLAIQGSTFTDSGSGTVHGPPVVCNPLSLMHTGMGGDPVSTPTNSTGCTAGNYIAGENIALNAAPDTGWRVTGWSGTDNDSSTSGNNTLTMPAMTAVVSVNYALNEYTLAYVAGTGGSISGSATQTVSHGASGSEVTAVPDTGYHFVDWSDGVLTAARTETNVTANVSVTANFALNEYTLAYAAGTGGSISGSAMQTVSHGAGGSQVTAVPDTGYHFVDWSDGVLTAARTETNVTANVSVTANFALDQFTLTVSGNIQRYNFPAANTNLDGVTVTLSGDQSGSTTTDANGNFSFSGLALGGDYLITPTLPGFSFDAINRSYSNVTADVTTANFTGYTGNSPRVIKAVSQNVSPSGPVVVPITLDSLGDENSLGFSVTYNSAVLTNPVIALGSDCGDCSLIPNPSAGQIGIIVSKPTLPTAVTFDAGTRQVITITFATTPVPPSYMGTIVTLGDAPTVREVINTNADPLFTTYVSGAVTFAVGYESDVAPRFAGDNTGIVATSDYTQTGRFAAGLDTINPLYNELQRVDSSPRPTKGNGVITVGDYVQAGRYAAGLDPASTVGGMAFPNSFGTEVPNRKWFDPDASVLPRVLTVADIDTSPGQQVTVSIRIAAEGDENGFGFTLNYDETKLSNPIVMTGADLPFSAPIPNTATPGKVGVVTAWHIYGGSIPAGDREIVKVRFDVSGTAPAGPTSIDFCGYPPVENEVSDGFAQVLATTFAAGTVNILGPTAAGVSVGGLVHNANGQAIPNARLTLTDPFGNVRTAVSNSFGYYRFDGIPVGYTYIVGVRAKDYSFTPRQVDVVDEVNNLNMEAEP